MNRNKFSALCVSFLIVFTSNAFCEDTQSDIKFKTDASLRIRHEFEDWAATTAQDSQSDFGHTKLQIGAAAESDIWKAYIQGQYFQLYGLDSNVAGGPDASYFSTNNSDSSPGGLNLRQANLTLRDSSKEKIKLLAGRFLYSGGAETVSAEPQISWVKSNRVAQRLIGPFDFTGGRSFDGARFDIKDDQYGTLTLHGSHPTQGGFETNSFETIDDISLLTAAWNLPLDEKTEDAQVFFYNYDDERNVTKTDNRPAEVRSLDDGQLDINTAGMYFIKLIPVNEDVVVDTLLWGGYQFGDWGALDHRAYSFDAEAGIKLKNLPAQPWFRVGHTYASGDSDNSDGDHKTFFPMMPTVRIYALTPLYSQQNLQETFLELILKPAEAFSLKGGIHFLRLAEGSDLQYFGSGATEQNTRFGYGGNNLGGSTDIGELIDIEATYIFNKNISITAYLGQMFGGSGYGKYAGPAGDKSITYGFLEMNLKI